MNPVKIYDDYYEIYKDEKIVSIFCDNNPVIINISNKRIICTKENLAINLTNALKQLYKIPITSEEEFLIALTIIRIEIGLINY